jgi:transposase
MKKVDEYEQIRKAYHGEGLSIREIGRRHGHGCRLIRKALEHPIPDKYQLGQSRKSAVLGQYRQRILDLLKESEKLPRKQRFTAHKIYEIVHREGYSGCEGFSERK